MNNIFYAIFARSCVALCCCWFLLFIDWFKLNLYDSFNHISLESIIPETVYDVMSGLLWHL